MTTEEFIIKAKQLHGDKYDYSQTVYVSSRTKLIVVCPEHGPFEQLAASHLQGNGCPGCARVWSDEHREHLRDSVRDSIGLTREGWIERARAVHGGKYDYSQVVYENQRSMVKIICPMHGVFEQKADSHIRGFGCRFCGNESENRKGVHNWSDAQREKTAATCRARYGADRYLDSQEGRDRFAELRATPEFRRKMRDIISSDEVQEKTKATCVERYGVTSAMKLPETVNKVWDSKLKNGISNTSQPEDDMYYVLCDRFGVSDVVCQYTDARYPFHCDFYVKSLDLFIELNAHWTHGGHWFDESNSDDLAIVDKWQQGIESGKYSYGIAINVWTVRDIRKRETAIKNRLNYVVFWDNDLSDFIDWIESDSLVLNNIL